MIGIENMISFCRSTPDDRLEFYEVNKIVYARWTMHIIMESWNREMNEKFVQF